MGICERRIVVLHVIQLSSFFDYISCSKNGTICGIKGACELGLILSGRWFSCSPRDRKDIDGGRVFYIHYLVLCLHDQNRRLELHDFIESVGHDFRNSGKSHKFYCFFVVQKELVETIELMNLNENFRSDLIDEICVICQDDFSGSSPICSPCNHYFHKRCIRKWLLIKATCPYCNGNLDLPHLETKEKERRITDFNRLLQNWHPSGMLLQNRGENEARAGPAHYGVGLRNV